jgi:hypothetical protein
MPSFQGAQSVACFASMALLGIGQDRSALKVGMWPLDERASTVGR